MCDCDCAACLGCEPDFEYEPAPAFGYAFGSPEWLAPAIAEIERDSALATPPDQIPPAFRARQRPELAYSSGLRAIAVAGLAGAASAAGQIQPGYRAVPA